jgi:hypothetical protein
MWRQIVAMLLMMGVAGGQTIPATSGQREEVPLLQDSNWQPDGDSLIQTSLADLIQRTPQARPAIMIVPHAGQRHSKLRSGREEQVAIFIDNQVTACVGCPLAVFPLWLELAPAPGFTVRYSDGTDFRMQPRGFMVPTRGGSALLFKVRTAPDLAPGSYTLKGRIAFRVTSDARWAEDQQVDIVLHVTVVAHNAEVAGNPWPWKPYGDHPGRDAFIAFITAPLIPFEVLYLIIDCDINPGHCSD